LVQRVTLPFADLNIITNPLVGGTQLTANQMTFSPNKCFKLIMQSDSNLVIYHITSGKPLWSTGTSKSGATRVIMQADGNLVLYDATGVPKWGSATFGNDGAFLIMQDDGNLVIYSKLGKKLWATGTSGTCP